MNNSMQIQKTQTKAIGPLEVLKNELNRMSGEFKPLLPASVTPDKFIRVVLNAVQNNPEFLTLDRKSLFSACMKCATDKLIPDGKEAALVKFGNLVQYLPMVGGICKRARQSGVIATMDAQVVYGNDSFEAWTDEKGPHFKHVRARGDRGEPIITYAYAITKEGHNFYEEMTEDQIQDVKNVSRSKDRGPWSGPFIDQMRRKTALHRLCKYRLPSSEDLEGVLSRDHELYDFKDSKPSTSKAQEFSEKLSVDLLAEGAPEVGEPPKPGDFEEFHGGPATIETTGKKV